MKAIVIRVPDDWTGEDAAVSVRMYLAHLRGTYRRNLSRDLDVYANRCVEKFDNALALYERLGGDPAQVLDIADEAGPP